LTNLLKQLNLALLIQSVEFSGKFNTPSKPIYSLVWTKPGVSLETNGSLGKPEESFIQTNLNLYPNKQF